MVMPSDLMPRNDTARYNDAARYLPFMQEYQQEPLITERVPMARNCISCVFNGKDMSGMNRTMPRCFHPGDDGVGEWRTRHFNQGKPHASNCPGWLGVPVGGDRIQTGRRADARQRARQGLPWRIYIEHTGMKNGKRRSAFYEAVGCRFTDEVMVRYGRIGGTGTLITMDSHQALLKIGDKLAGGYAYPGSAPPIDSVPEPKKVLTLKERLPGVTMRPTTMDNLFARISRDGWVRQNSTTDYTKLFERCQHVALYVDNDDAMFAVLMYPDDEIVYGKVDAA